MAPVVQIAYAEPNDDFDPKTLICDGRGGGSVLLLSENPEGFVERVLVEYSGNTVARISLSLAEPHSEAFFPLMSASPTSEKAEDREAAHHALRVLAAFLDTCAANSRKMARELGVELRIFEQ
jgi:hypothetical protein